MTELNKKSGFAVVIALSLMAFVILLLLSLITLVRVETAGAAQSAATLQARQNALLGLQIALGELQKHAGPDQRVSAAATVAYPDADELKRLYQANALDRGGFRTILDGSGQAAFTSAVNDWWADKNPRWFGIWDSRLNAGSPDRAQSPVWLVSGNEGKAPDDADYFSPDTALPVPGDASATTPTTTPTVWLVDTGSATEAADASDGLDGRVRAPKQAISAPGGSASGHYAYWVSDESTKANLAKRDPFFTETNPNSVAYRNRLLAPQRMAWEQIGAFADAVDASGFDPNDPRLERLLAPSQTALFGDAFNPASPALRPDQRHFHDVTTVSESLFTDTARGGLKKDLTAFFERGEGLSVNDPIPDPADYSGDTRFGASNSGFPGSDNNIPTWQQLKSWHDNQASGSSGSISVSEDVGPVVTSYRIMVGFSRFGDEVRMHLLPFVTLWNPFDAGLNSQTYKLKVEMPISLKDFSVATEGKTPADASEGEIIGTSAFMRHQLRSRYDNSVALLHSFDPWEATVPLSFNLTADFGAGESKVFSVLTNQEVINPSIAGGAGTDGIVVQLDEGFDDDFPATAYFEIFQIQGAPPAASENSIFFLGVEEGSTAKSHPRMLLSGGTYTSTYRDFGFFEPGFIWQNALRGNSKSAHNALRDGTNTNWQGAWRELFVSRASPGDSPANFTANIQGQRDTFAGNSPIFALAHSYLAPFSVNNWTRTRMTRILREHYRAFAVYNLNAKEVSRHPEVEAERSLNPFANADRFPSLQIAQSRVFAAGGSSNPTSIRWDENLTDVSSGGTAGFSLITPFFETTNLEYKGLNELPLRVVRRTASELLSIGQLQQVNLSPFFWQPTFPIGNSEASPYVDRDLMAGIVSRSLFNGLNSAARPNSADNSSVDLSYLLNDALWDRYFLSALPNSSSKLDQVVAGTAELPNSRIRIRSEVSDTGDLLDFDDAARGLVNRGAFNVNSTSVAAWKALLLAFRDLQIEGPSGGNPGETVPVSRTLQPQMDGVEFTFESGNATDIGAVSSNRNYSQVLAGFRYLTDSMVEELARRIVDEVKLRGPFLSLSDFVNRRLVAPERSSGVWDQARTQAPAGGEGVVAEFMTSAYDVYAGLSGINGALQRAINTSGINGGVNYQTSGINRDLDRVYEVRSDASATGGDNRHLFSIYPTMHYYLDTEHLAGAPAGESGQLMSHAAGFVTQGDLLSMIGSALTARGDTFKIRSYGDVINPVTGNADGKIWLEAVVQRVPEPVTDIDGDYEPDDAFGRRFEIVNLRWLQDSEI